NSDELTPPSTRHHRPTPPTPTLPFAPPRPSAASHPLRLAQTPREPPRRRAPSSNGRPRRGPTSSSPHFATQEHPENRLGLYSVFPNLPLATGEPLAGKLPVKPRVPPSDPAQGPRVGRNKTPGGYLNSRRHI